MNSPKTPTILGFALVIEILIGIFFLLISGGWVTLLIIAVLLGGFAVMGYFLSSMGVGSDNNATTNTNEWNNNNMNTGQWNWSGNIGRSRFNVRVNPNAGPERTETLQQTLPLNAEIKSFLVEVGVGSLKVTGQPGLTEIKVTATKKVYASDELTARTELDQLQVHSWLEGQVLRFYAGPPEGLRGSTLSIGRTNRVDVEILVPPTLTATYNTTSGELVLRELTGDVTARAGSGNITAEKINGGKNLNLHTDAGKIVIQEVAVALLKVRTAAGVQELTGIGAESLDLSSGAGNIRARGVNCGAYKASANAGSVELYDGNVENTLDLHTNLGQVTVENSRAARLDLRTDSGGVNYRGYAPTQDSQIRSGLGSVNITLAPGASFNLEARSNIGSVLVYQPAARITSQSQNYFAGQIGMGGPLLRVNTQMGSIKVS